MIGDSSSSSSLPFQCGTYTCGEVRTSIGDRRHDGANRRYAKDLVHSDASFRVLSNERRGLEAKAGVPDCYSDEVPLRHCGAGAALEAVFEALGIKQDEFSNVAGVPVKPEVYQSERTIDGRWSVEVCYVCGDCAPLEILRAHQRQIGILQQELANTRSYAATLEKTLEKLAEKKGMEDSATQTEPSCCADSRCPHCPAGREIATQTSEWCTSCGRQGHTAVDCPVPLCSRCGVHGHSSMECPLQQREERGDQTAPFCQLCGEFGHSFMECKLPAEGVERTPTAAAAGPTMKMRVGGGFVCAPDVPAPASGHLDEEAARPSVGCRVKVCEPKPPPKRPSSAPPRRVSDHSFRVRERGPERQLAKQQEHERLRRRNRTGREHCQDRPNGYLHGTYIHGTHDRRHRCASEQGSRTAFRVYRSYVAPDSAESVEIGNGKGARQSGCGRGGQEGEAVQDQHDRGGTFDLGFPPPHPPASQQPLPREPPPQPSSKLPPPALTLLRGPTALQLEAKVTGVYSDLVSLPGLARAECMASALSARTMSARTTLPPSPSNALGSGAGLEQVPSPAGSGSSGGFFVPGPHELRPLGANTSGQWPGC